MATIVHFEIPSDNIERTKKFYSGLFGWKMEKMPGPTEYWMFTTTNEKGEKMIGGGIMKKMHPQQPITNYISVPSVDEYTKKVQSLGGKVMVPKTEVSGYGYFAQCIDTEGNVFAIWEATQMHRQS
jgi:predicted enzyme related to lactoylglutathione lyase